MQVIEAQADMPIEGVVTLYSSLLTFTLHVHHDRLDYVDQILVGSPLKYISMEYHDSLCSLLNIFVLNLDPSLWISCFIAKISQ